MDTTRLAPLASLLLAVCGCVRAVEPVDAEPPATLTAPAPPISTPAPPVSAPAVLPGGAADKLLRADVDAVLRALAARDMKELARHVHPKKGVRFSPYRFVDPGDAKHPGDVVVGASDLVAAYASETRRLWGHFDGSGDPIDLTFRKYVARFVYDVDFARAPVVRLDADRPPTMTNDNLASVYPGCRIVELHFDGLDPKYEGMDFRSLHLVFELEGERRWLVGVAHDEWGP